MSEETKRAAKKKSRAVAVMLSALACPGAGQIYKGHRLRGILMVVVSLLLLTALTLKIIMLVVEMTVTVPPEQMLADAYGIAHRMLQSDSGFLKVTGYGFLAVYVYGILDAAIARPEEP